jgi:hypothetical protein
VDEGLLFADVLGVGAALGEVVSLAVAFPDVVELVLVEGGAHHDAAHLEVLVVLLVEVALLASRLLAEEVYVHCPFQPFFRPLLLFPHGFHQLVVTNAFLVHPLPLHLNYNQLPNLE